MNQLSTAAQQDTNLNLWFLPHNTYIHSCGSEELRKLNQGEGMNHCTERAGYLQIAPVAIKARLLHTSRVLPRA